MVEKLKILIFGAEGMLGQALISELKNHQITAPSVDKVDIVNKKVIQREINKNKPDIVINCAALTNVDQCEDHIEDAVKRSRCVPGHDIAGDEGVQAGDRISRGRGGAIQNGVISSGLYPLGDIPPDQCLHRTHRGCG